MHTSYVIFEICWRCKFYATKVASESSPMLIFDVISDLQKFRESNVFTKAFHVVFQYFCKLKFFLTNVTQIIFFLIPDVQAQAVTSKWNIFDQDPKIEAKVEPVKPVDHVMTNLGEKLMNEEIDETRGTQCEISGYFCHSDFT